MTRKLLQQALDALGCVLTYRTTGHNKPCGNTVGANGIGEYVVLVTGNPLDSEQVAREYLRNLERNGYRITEAILVTNEEAYTGKPISVIHAPSTELAKPEAQPQESDYDLTIAYLSGVADGKRSVQQRKPLADEVIHNIMRESGLRSIIDADYRASKKSLMTEPEKDALNADMYFARAIEAAQGITGEQ